MNIDEKISKIEPKIKEPFFLENKGLSNEVGYYIFDYNPKYELKVREEVSRLKNKYTADSNHSFFIVEFDLYEVIIELLRNEGYLKDIFIFEEEDGIDETINAIVTFLQLNSDENNLIVNHIINKTPDNCVVFLTGVGKSYPILRSHNVLNNLHQKLNKVPVVLFFPGKYSGTDLVLFNTLEGSNYYRAFPLII
ncbi:hypothetical protein MBORA_08830 [Methanobrevibacter oralis]|uniref:DUF1788 domain-containing protein n=1 Tax=Methanobrevibacter oralis TaxID=66851 RepID=A0A166B7P9_METOA|nr:DUF1788 domain-containing protein [Methanobrevibacter oralis]KZX12982.1 hypothetical protein MBORA_08830 [Methanobrevibacter oralis]